MAKTNPIGVRFRQDILDQLKTIGVDSPQKALVHLERFYVTHKDKVNQFDVLREKPIEKPGTDYNSETIAKLKKIIAETIPDHRNTPNGKKVWEMDQKNLIYSLLKQLNN